MSLNSREFLIWIERERERVRERGMWVGQQAYIFKVKFGLEGRERERHRNKET
jgi:hypothetical protein